jgi:hypothetical protein
MAKTSQISAFVSKATKDLLERHVRATGVKKGHVIETALQQYLLALQELPADVIIPSTITVTRRSFEKMLEQEANPEPAPALRELMAADGD